MARPGLEVETPLQWFDLTKPVGILFFYDAEMFTPSEALQWKNLRRRGDSSQYPSVCWAMAGTDSRQSDSSLPAREGLSADAGTGKDDACRWEGELFSRRQWDRAVSAQVR